MMSTGIEQTYYQGRHVVEKSNENFQQAIKKQGKIFLTNLLPLQLHIAFILSAFLIQLLSSFCLCLFCSWLFSTCLVCF